MLERQEQGRGHPRGWVISVPTSVLTSKSALSIILCDIGFIIVGPPPALIDGYYIHRDIVRCQYYFPSPRSRSPRPQLKMSSLSHLSVNKEIEVEEDPDDHELEYQSIITSQCVGIEWMLSRVINK